MGGCADAKLILAHEARGSPVLRPAGQRELLPGRWFLTHPNAAIVDTRENCGRPVGPDTNLRLLSIIRKVPAKSWVYRYHRGLPMLDKLLRVTLKKLLLIVAVWGLCVILHNGVNTLLRDSFRPDFDEPFFFLLAVVVIPLYLGVATVYTLRISEPRS